METKGEIMDFSEPMVLKNAVGWLKRLNIEEENNMANFRLHYFSEVLQMNVGVNIIIPENTWGHSLADRPKGYRYPVLWLQSGGGFDYTDWQRYTALELYAAEAGVAVVCSGTYCSGYMDTKHGDFKYFTQLSIETPKVVRHLFPLSEKPEENYIAGFSMGGYGTLKWMLRDPEQFAAFGFFFRYKKCTRNSSGKRRQRR